MREITIRYHRKSKNIDVTLDKYKILLRIPIFDSKYFKYSALVYNYMCVCRILRRMGFLRKLH